MIANVQLKRVFKIAPWRVQTQAVAAAAVFCLVLAALGGLYLATATRAATAGRDVQRLEAEKTELMHELERLEAEVALAQSVGRMEARARELGFVPAGPERVDYLVVEGYPAPPPPLTMADTKSLPDYDETLTSWLTEHLSEWETGR